MVHNRRGAVDLGTILMVAAFAVIGGFLFWLNGQAAIERAAQEIVEEVEPEEELDPGVQTVTGEDIQMDATPFEGQEIRLQNFEVQSTLGTQGFWLGMPNGNPFLVSMSAEVMAEGIAVAQGNTATVIGVVQPMDAATLDAWSAAGTISDNDRIVAEFATHFLDASRVEVSTNEGGSGN